MQIQDWYEIPDPNPPKMFSVNGVPYPLDEYLKLKGEPTIERIAELIKRWG